MVRAPGKGHISGVSDEVLRAVARALQLDEAERLHLFDLARAARPIRPPRRRASQAVRPSVLRILESMSGTPAFIRNGRLDVLAVNPLGQALYSPVFDAPARPANLARFCFLDPVARDFYPDWDEVAQSTVALLHTEAGRDPYDRELSDMVGEFATRSEAFRTLWAAHDVQLHQYGTKHFRHPVVGLMDVDFDSMPLPASEDQGLTLTCYSAESGSPSDDALKMLASWIASSPVRSPVSPGDDLSADERAR